MTDQTDRVTRADIERSLQVLTGFKADAAEIEERMVLIDIYAAFLADCVTEPFLHLLTQQAELLLDSGQTLSARLDLLSGQVAELALKTEWAVESVTNLTVPPLVVELTATERETVAATLEPRRSTAIPEEKVARLYELFEEGVSESRAAALVGVSRSSANKYRNTWKASRRPAGEFDDLSAADAVLREHTRLSQEIEEAEMPAWERELLEKQAADQERGTRMVDKHTEIFCSTCGEWKTADHFYKNQKSKTGYETKCRECRPPRVTAA